VFITTEDTIMPISTITRRAALTGTAAGAAAIVAGAAPVLANDDHDRAEWLALWQDYMAKERALEFCDDGDEDAVNDARWAAGDHISEKPATTISGLAVKLAYALYWDSQADPAGRSTDRFRRKSPGR
jgi:hypothetical protein